MACYHPVNVPINRKSVFPGLRLRYVQEVGCGHCLGCRSDQARDWTLRMMHEAQMHDVSWFLTLTYSDEELPEDGALNPEHLRSFIRDLRRLYPAGTVSYYGCGEYGTVTRRAHYHAVLFGAYLLDLMPDPDDSRDGVWISPTIETTWSRGRTHLGPVTYASAAYVAGYVQKKVRDKEELLYNGVTGEILRPFARMSTNPAIGRRWIEKFWRDVYPRDYVLYDGKEVKPPRYYDKWMDFPDEKGGSAERRELMEEVRGQRYEEMVDLDTYTLNAKEVAHEKRQEMFARRDAL